MPRMLPETSPKRGTLADARGTLADARGTLADARGTLADASGTLADASLLRACGAGPGPTVLRA